MTTDYHDPATEVTAFLSDLMAETLAMRRPDGSSISISVPRGRWTYRYFEGASGALYCWTVFPCDRGRYYAFTYRPIGRGSRSGKATHWRMVDLVAFARRNRAKARAAERLAKERRPEPAEGAAQ
jgi:hypothetical protein